jgi:hypothetical protein
MLDFIVAAQIFWPIGRRFIRLSRANREVVRGLSEQARLSALAIRLNCPGGPVVH